MNTRSFLRRLGLVRWKEEIPCPEARMLASGIDLELATSVLQPDVLDRIRAGLTDPRASEQIAAAVELRKRLAESYETQRLGRLVTYLRERYRVATDREGAVIDGGTLSPVETMSHEALLGEADSLLERLKVIYTVSSLRDVQVDRLRRSSLWILAVLLVLLTATQLPAMLGQTPRPVVDLTLNLAVIALIGAVGALVSIMRRSQKALDLGPIDIDPVRQISALRHGASGMLIAASVGPVLALVLFAVFAGNMIEISGLTPEISACGTDGTKAKLCSFSFLGQNLGFEKPTDAAKMAIWAFLAGFAEQLVPDVLDKFSKAAREAPVQPRPQPAPPTPLASPVANGPTQPKPAQPRPPRSAAGA